MDFVTSTSGFKSLGWEVGVGVKEGGICGAIDDFDNWAMDILCRTSMVVLILS